MRVQLKVLLNQLRITAVFVTHDQIEALSLSDRIGPASALALLAPLSTIAGGSGEGKCQPSRAGAPACTAAPGGSVETYA
jgi:ABC-type sugar transport system ATPase subunit